MGKTTRPEGTSQLIEAVREACSQLSGYGDNSPQNKAADALCDARDAVIALLAECEKLATVIRAASMGESRPARGETFIGWQRGDDGNADTARQLARDLYNRLKNNG